MSSTPVEANVVLTADNSQYDASMQQSAGATDKLSHSVDSLGAKINNISKSAGRKFLGIGAADVAVITAATAAWASYEKQVSRLQAQAAVVTRTRDGENKVMKEYTSSVENLRKQYGTTTTAAAELTQQISKLSDQTRPIKDLANVFEEMSKATGENATGLANSLLNLQKIMGTPQTQTKNYADQLTYLAAKSDTSATALAQFTAQIAPMGRAIGMSQTQVTGFSNMFIKAGQDGYSAATAFNKVTQDITTAVQTGNPDLHKYANLLGMTVSQFKEMSGAEQVASFLDQIAKLGPKAALTLNQFGFDGIRMSKAITGTVQASGGAMNAIREAQIGYGSDATAKGAEAAHTMSDTFAKLRQDMALTAEAFGKAFGPGVDLVLRQIERLASGFNNLMEGPLGKFLQVAAAVVVPVTAAAGALLLLAGTITKVAAAFALVRGSPGLGVLEGLRGGSRIVPELTESGLRTGRFVAAAGRGGVPSYLGRQGANIAEGGTWLQRGSYNVGQAAGSGVRRTFGWLGGVGTSPLEEGGAQRMNIWGRGLRGGIRLGGDLAVSQLDAMRFANPAQRSQWLGQQFPGRGPQMEEAMGARATAMQRLGVAQAVGASVAGAQGASPQMKEAAEKEIKTSEELVQAKDKEVKAILTSAEVDAKTAAAKVAASKAEMGVLATLRAELGAVTKAFAGAAVGAEKFAITTAAAGVAAGAGALGRAGMAAVGGPLNAAMMAAMVAPLLIPLGKGIFNKMFGEDQQHFTFEDYRGAGSTYMAAGGITPPPGGALRAPPAPPRTAAQARQVTPEVAAQATVSTAKLADTRLEGLTSDQAVSYLGTNYDLYRNNPEALASLRSDLILKYGASGAQDVFNKLESGNYAKGAGTFFAAAKGSTGNRSDLLNAAFGVSGDRAALAGARRGPGAEFQARATGMTRAFQQAFTGTDMGFQGDVREALGKYYGLEISQQDWQRLEAAGGINQRATGGRGAQVRPPTAEQERIREALTGKDPVKMLQTIIEQESPEVGEQLRNQLNIPLSATGTDLTKALRETSLGQAGGGLPADSQERLARKVRESSPLGAAFEGSRAVQKALAQGATNGQMNNIASSVAAINAMMDKIQKTGMSAPEVTKAMGKIQSAFGDPNDPNYILAGMITAQAQQDLALKIPTMTRAGGFQAQVGMFQAVESIKPVTDQQYQNQQDAKVAMAQQLGDQMQYFKQMLLMQEQYELQRGRAQDDYHQQRTWQEQAYHLQRQRAEADFGRQQKFALADYHRSVRRANFEFQLQRQRTEADFNHQVEIQAKQMATSVYDVYQRVQATRTSSANWLLANAGDQLKRMQEQEDNLQKLRAQGLSNTAIQTLKLTDPAQAAEAARLVAEMTPQLVNRFNKVAGTERVKAAKALVTDPSSLQWEEDRRNLRIQERRSQQDHDRQMKLGHDDFFRNMERSRDEFNRMMSRQATDEMTALSHMETQYETSMDRAAEDIALAGKEISGGLMKILNQSIESLTGNARQQAIAVKKSLNDLRSDTNPIAVAHMQELSKIYGFQYKVPAGIGHYLAVQEGPQASPEDVPGRHPGTQIGRAQGGVLPGWSPGKDDRMVPLSGGEAIMRPEWARAVGEKNIDQMNHAARHGGYWLGGVEPLRGASASQHTTGYPFATWAGDLNYPGYADYGKPILAWRAGVARPFDYHADTSYGRGQVIDSGNQSSLYAHMSKVLTGLAGKRVQAGQVIGYVGDYGNTGTPPTSHLHFEIRGGRIDLGDADTGDAPTGRAAGARFSDVFKKTYGKAEAAAWRMTGAHPLNPGDISKVINRLGRRAWRRFNRQYGVEDPGSPIGDSADVPGAPANVSGAVAIGKRMAAAMGWTGNEWDALYQLWQHESGWRWNADNPTSSAYGIPQALPGSKMATAGSDWATNPATQIEWGLNYIKGRSDYGSPSKAWSLWQQRDPHWYGDGAVFNKATRIGVGERGPEAVIPLNDRGGEFLTKAMLGADARGIGLHSSPMRGGLSVYNTKIDRSTNFSGPITVQANDPGELIGKLQARQRVMALSRPSLTGSAA